jgi:hypothetical protein
MVPKIGLTGATRWGETAVRWRRRIVAGIWPARTGSAKSPMDWPLLPREKELV